MAPNNEARRRRQQAKRIAQQQPPQEAIYRVTLFPTVPLVSVLLQLGRCHEALAILLQELPPPTRPVGHASVITFFWLGAVYTELGQHDRALHYFQRAMTGMEDLVGEATQPTVRMTRMVAMSYKALGRIGEARAFFRLADDRLRQCEGFVEGWLNQPQGNAGIHRNVAGRDGGSSWIVRSWWWGIVVCIVLSVLGIFGVMMSGEVRPVVGLLDGVIL